MASILPPVKFGQNDHWEDTLHFNKVERVFPMAIVSILPLAEFERNGHREDAPHFILVSTWDLYIFFKFQRFLCKHCQYGNARTDHIKLHIIKCHPDKNPADYERN